MERRRPKDGRDRRSLKAGSRKDQKNGSPKVGKRSERPEFRKQSPEKPKPETESLMGRELYLKKLVLLVLLQDQKKAAEKHYVIKNDLQIIRQHKQYGNTRVHWVAYTDAYRIQREAKSNQGSSKKIGNNILQYDKEANKV